MQNNTIRSSSLSELRRQQKLLRDQKWPMMSYFGQNERALSLYQSKTSNADKNLKEMGRSKILAKNPKMQLAKFNIEFNQLLTKLSKRETMEKSFKALIQLVKNEKSEMALDIIISSFSCRQENFGRTGRELETLLIGEIARIYNNLLKPEVISMKVNRIKKLVKVVMQNIYMDNQKISLAMSQVMCDLYEDLLFERESSDAELTIQTLLSPLIKIVTTGDLLHVQGSAIFIIRTIFEKAIVLSDTPLTNYIAQIVIRYFLAYKIYSHDYLVMLIKIFTLTDSRIWETSMQAIIDKLTHFLENKEAENNHKRKAEILNCLTTIAESIKVNCLSISQVDSNAILELSQKMMINRVFGVMEAAKACFYAWFSVSSNQLQATNENALSKFQSLKQSIAFEKSMMNKGQGGMGKFYSLLKNDHGSVDKKPWDRSQFQQSQKNDRFAYQTNFAPKRQSISNPRIVLPQTLKSSKAAYSKVNSRIKDLVEKDRINYRSSIANGEAIDLQARKFTALPQFSSDELINSIDDIIDKELPSPLKRNRKRANNKLNQNAKTFEINTCSSVESDNKENESSDMSPKKFNKRHEFSTKHKRADPKHSRVNNGFRHKFTHQKSGYNTENNSQVSESKEYGSHVNFTNSGKKFKAKNGNVKNTKTRANEKGSSHSEENKFTLKVNKMDSVQSISYNSVVDLDEYQPRSKTQKITSRYNSPTKGHSNSNQQDISQTNIETAHMAKSKQTRFAKDEFIQNQSASSYSHHKLSSFKKSTKNATQKNSSACLIPSIETFSSSGQHSSSESLQNAKRQRENRPLSKIHLLKEEVELDNNSSDSESIKNSSDEDVHKNKINQVHKIRPVVVKTSKEDAKSADKGPAKRLTPIISRKNLDMAENDIYQEEMTRGVQRSLNLKKPEKVKFVRSVDSEVSQDIYEEEQESDSEVSMKSPRDLRSSRKSGNKNHEIAIESRLKDQNGKMNYRRKANSGNLNHQKSEKNESHSELEDAGHGGFVSSKTQENKPNLESQNVKAIPKRVTPSNNRKKDSGSSIDNVSGSRERYSSDSKDDEINRVNNNHRKAYNSPRHMRDDKENKNERNRSKVQKPLTEILSNQSLILKSNDTNKYTKHSNDPISFGARQKRPSDISSKQEKETLRTKNSRYIKEKPETVNDYTNQDDTDKSVNSDPVQEMGVKSKEQSHENNKSLRTTPYRTKEEKSVFKNEHPAMKVRRSESREEKASFIDSENESEDNSMIEDKSSAELVDVKRRKLKNNTNHPARVDNYRNRGNNEVHPKRQLLPDVDAKAINSRSQKKECAQTDGPRGIKNEARIKDREIIKIGDAKNIILKPKKKKNEQSNSLDSKERSDVSKITISSKERVVKKIDSRQQKEKKVRSNSLEDQEKVDFSENTNSVQDDNSNDINEHKRSPQQRRNKEDQNRFKQARAHNDVANIEANSNPALQNSDEYSQRNNEKESHDKTRISAPKHSQTRQHKKKNEAEDYSKSNDSILRSPPKSQPDLSDESSQRRPDLNHDEDQKTGFKRKNLDIHPSHNSSSQQRKVTRNPKVNDSLGVPTKDKIKHRKKNLESHYKGNEKDKSVDSECQDKPQVRDNPKLKQQTVKSVKIFHQEQNEEDLQSVPRANTKNPRVADENISKMPMIISNPRDQAIKNHSSNIPGKETNDGSLKKRNPTNRISLNFQQGSYTKPEDEDGNIQSNQNKPIIKKQQRTAISKKAQGKKQSSPLQDNITVSETNSLSNVDCSQSNLQYGNHEKPHAKNPQQRRILKVDKNYKKAAGKLSPNLIMTKDPNKNSRGSESVNKSSGDITKLGQQLPELQILSKQSDFKKSTGEFEKGKSESNKRRKKNREDYQIEQEKDISLSKHNEVIRRNSKSPALGATHKESPHHGQQSNNNLDLKHKPHTLRDDTSEENISNSPNSNISHDNKSNDESRKSSNNRQKFHKDVVTNKNGIDHGKIHDNAHATQPVSKQSLLEFENIERAIRKASMKNSVNHGLMINKMMDPPKLKKDKTVARKGSTTPGLQNDPQILRRRDNQDMDDVDQRKKKVSSHPIANDPEYSQLSNSISASDSKNRLNDPDHFKSESDDDSKLQANQFCTFNKNKKQKIKNVTSNFPSARKNETIKCDDRSSLNPNNEDETLENQFAPNYEVNGRKGPLEKASALKKSEPANEKDAKISSRRPSLYELRRRSHKLASQENFSQNEKDNASLAAKPLDKNNQKFSRRTSKAQPPLPLNHIRNLAEFTDKNRVNRSKDTLIHDHALNDIPTSQFSHRNNQIQTSEAYSPTLDKVLNKDNDKKLKMSHDDSSISKLNREMDNLGRKQPSMALKDEPKKQKNKTRSSISKDIKGAGKSKMKSHSRKVDVSSNDHSPEQRRSSSRDSENFQDQNGSRNHEALNTIDHRGNIVKYDKLKHKTSNNDRNTHSQTKKEVKEQDQQTGEQNPDKQKKTPSNTQNKPSPTHKPHRLNHDKSRKNSGKFSNSSGSDLQESSEDHNPHHALENNQIQPQTRKRASKYLSNNIAHKDHSEIHTPHGKSKDLKHYSPRDKESNSSSVNSDIESGDYAKKDKPDQSRNIKNKQPRNNLSPKIFGGAKQNNHENVKNEIDKVKTYASNALGRNSKGKSKVGESSEISDSLSAPEKSVKNGNFMENGSNIRQSKQRKMSQYRSEDENIKDTHKNSTSKNESKRDNIGQYPRKQDARKSSTSHPPLPTNSNRKKLFKNGRQHSNSQNHSGEQNSPTDRRRGSSMADMVRKPSLISATKQKGPDLRESPLYEQEQNLGTNSQPGHLNAKDFPTIPRDEDHNVSKLKFNHRIDKKSNQVPLRAGSRSGRRQDSYIEDNSPSDFNNTEKNNLQKKAIQNKDRRNEYGDRYEEQQKSTDDIYEDQFVNNDDMFKDKPQNSQRKSNQNVLNKPNVDLSRHDNIEEMDDSRSQLQNQVDDSKNLYRKNLRKLENEPSAREETRASRRNNTFEEPRPVNNTNQKNRSLMQKDHIDSQLVKNLLKSKRESQNHQSPRNEQDSHSSDNNSSPHGENKNLKSSNYRYVQKRTPPNDLKGNLRNDHYQNNIEQSDENSIEERQSDKSYNSNDELEISKSNHTEKDNSKPYRNNPRRNDQPPKDEKFRDAPKKLTSSRDNENGVNNSTANSKKLKTFKKADNDSSRQDHQLNTPVEREVNSNRSTISKQASSIISNKHQYKGSSPQHSRANKRPSFKEETTISQNANPKMISLKSDSFSKSNPNRAPYDDKSPLETINEENTMSRLKNPNSHMTTHSQTLSHKKIGSKEDTLEPNHGVPNQSTKNNNTNYPKADSSKLPVRKLSKSPLNDLNDQNEQDGRNHRSNSYVENLDGKRKSGHTANKIAPEKPESQKTDSERSISSKITSKMDKNQLSSDIDAVTSDMKAKARVSSVLKSSRNDRLDGRSSSNFLKAKKRVRISTDFQIFSEPFQANHQTRNSISARSNYPENSHSNKRQSNTPVQLSNSLSEEKDSGTNFNEEDNDNDFANLSKSRSQRKMTKQESAISHNKKINQPVAEVKNCEVEFGEEEEPLALNRAPIGPNNRPVHVASTTSKSKPGVNPVNDNIKDVFLDESEDVRRKDSSLSINQKHKNNHGQSEHDEENYTTIIHSSNMRSETEISDEEQDAESINRVPMSNNGSRKFKSSHLNNSHDLRGLSSEMINNRQSTRKAFEKKSDTQSVISKKSNASYNNHIKIDSRSSSHTPHNLGTYGNDKSQGISKSSFYENREFNNSKDISDDNMNIDDNQYDKYKRFTLKQQQSKPETNEQITYKIAKTRLPSKVSDQLHRQPTYKSAKTENPVPTLNASYMVQKSFKSIHKETDTADDLNPITHIDNDGRTSDKNNDRSLNTPNESRSVRNSISGRQVSNNPHRRDSHKTAGRSTSNKAQEDIETISLKSPTPDINLQQVNSSLGESYCPTVLINESNLSNINNEQSNIKNTRVKPMAHSTLTSERPSMKPNPVTIRPLNVYIDENSKSPSNLPFNHPLDKTHRSKITAENETLLENTEKAQNAKRDSHTGKNHNFKIKQLKHQNYISDKAINPLERDSNIQTNPTSEKKSSSRIRITSRVLNSNSKTISVTENDNTMQIGYPLENPNETSNAKHLVKRLTREYSNHTYKTASYSALQDSIQKSSKYNSNIKTKGTDDPTSAYHYPQTKYKDPTENQKYSSQSMMDTEIAINSHVTSSIGSTKNHRLIKKQMPDGVKNRAIENKNTTSLQELSEYSSSMHAEVKDNHRHDISDADLNESRSNNINYKNLITGNPDKRDPFKKYEHLLNVNNQTTERYDNTLVVSQYNDLTMEHPNNREIENGSFSQNRTIAYTTNASKISRNQSSVKESTREQIPVSKKSTPVTKDNCSYISKTLQKDNEFNRNSNATDIDQENVATSNLRLQRPNYQDGQKQRNIGLESMFKKASSLADQSKRIPTLLQAHGKQSYPYLQAKLQNNNQQQYKISPFNKDIKNQMIADNNHFANDKEIREQSFGHNDSDIDGPLINSDYQAKSHLLARHMDPSRQHIFKHVNLGNSIALKRKNSPHALELDSLQNDSHPHSLNRSHLYKTDKLITNNIDEANDDDCSEQESQLEMRETMLCDETMEMDSTVYFPSTTVYYPNTDSPLGKCPPQLKTIAYEENNTIHFSNFKSNTISCVNPNSKRSDFEK